MKIFIISFLFFLSYISFAQNDSVQVSLDENNSSLIIDSTFSININDSVNQNDTVSFVQSDSTNGDSLSEEAKSFIEDTKLITDSLDNDNQNANAKSAEVSLDTTKPYGVKFIKEFEMSGGVYHYLLMDAQHHEKLIHKPKWTEKTHTYDYEDLIVKLEIRGDKMNLYSIIFAEAIIGSLERFDKNYYVSDGQKILRVEQKAGHHHFFKEFERLYLNGDDTILKGKKFKTIQNLVKFWNEYDMETAKKEAEVKKYEVVD